MQITAKPKNELGNSQVFRGVYDIAVSKFEGIVYLVLVFNNRKPNAFIPADEFYLYDQRGNKIEVVGH